VFKDILECSPLMMGGSERTIFYESKITGYTGEFEIMGR
jgi:hypothetical protein